MELDHAIELVGAVNSFAYYAMGLQEPRSIKNATLAELMQARDVVEAQNRRREGATGTKTLMCVPDDRLIAAVFTARHYEAQDQDDVDPIVRTPASFFSPHGTALVHIRLKPVEEPAGVE